MFNQRERRLGAVIIHFLVAVYISWAIAIVCDDYFVPCMELISVKTKLQSDVAGATFMAFGCSAPELFASIIGELEEFMHILGFWCTIFYERFKHAKSKNRLILVPGVFPPSNMTACCPPLMPSVEKAQGTRLL